MPKRRRKFDQSTFVTENFPTYQRLLEQDAKRYRRSLWIKAIILILVFAGSAYLGNGI